jgi:hypothetical protein
MTMFCSSVFFVADKGHPTIKIFIRFGIILAINTFDVNKLRIQQKNKPKVPNKT